MPHNTHPIAVKPSALKPSAVKLVVLISLGLGLASMPLARAGTPITGHHDGNTPDGLDLTGGNYSVADGTTFDSNAAQGLSITGAGITITGGDFSSNNAAGLETHSSNADISGGTFSGNHIVGASFFDSTATISGGTFQDAGSAVNANNSQIIITGGIFSGGGGAFTSNSLYDFGSFNQSTVTLYGQFTGLASGETLTLPSGDGSFTGTLLNDTSVQTFTYAATGNGKIILNAGSPPAVSPAPEPSQSAALAFMGIGLAAVVLTARKRRKVTAAS